MRFLLIFIPFVWITAAAVEGQEAEDNATLPPSHESWFESGIDDFQQYWSRKVLIFSSNLDSLFAGEDQNITSADTNQTESSYPGEHISKPQLENKEKTEIYVTSTWFDEFFKDETYLDTNNKSYVRIRAGYEYDKRGDSSVLHNIKARLKLPRTKDKWQLFIGDEADDKLSLSDAPRPSGGEGVGLKYFFPALYGRLFANASVGFSGIDNPYARTDLEYPVFLGSWLFKAAQNFKYSVEDKFDEWTDFSFDHKLSDRDLVRVLLQRSTNSEIKGMEYLLRLSYRNALHHDIGTSYYVGFNGRTRDLPGNLYANGLVPQEGVYEYVAGIVWRQQLYKSYIFYQIEPIVSFHEQYDYRSNYLLRLSVDLYFGYTP